MTKQMNITVRDSEFGDNAAHITIAAEGRPETFRIVPTDRVRMFILNVSATAAAAGFQANVRDLRKNV
jgi:hypothetical protein